MNRFLSLLFILLMSTVLCLGCNSSTGDNDDNDGSDSGYTVSGRVVDDDGKGIPDVKVMLGQQKLPSKIAMIPVLK